MKWKFAILVSFVLAFALSSCGKSEVQNENLPEGMKTGYWFDNENNGYVFFENGYWTEEGGQVVGTYSLIAPDSIMLEWPDRTRQLDIVVAETGERIVLSRFDKDDKVLDLIIPDTSSGNIKKEIIGSWEIYSTLFHLGDGQSETLEFKRNGDLILSDEDNDEIETSTYEFVGDKVMFEILDESFIFNVLSLGDLIYLADLDAYTGNSDTSRWIFLVRR